jgi:hypothetical protein
VYYAATPPAPMSNIPIDQFATAVYPPGKLLNNILNYQKTYNTVMTPVTGYFTLA